MFCASSASATCRFDPSVERNPANTLCPERERVSAVKRPKPLDAPVIRIVFPIVLLESLILKVTAHCRCCLGDDRDDLTPNLLLAIPDRPRTGCERMSASGGVLPTQPQSRPRAVGKNAIFGANSARCSSVGSVLWLLRACWHNGGNGHSFAPGKQFMKSDSDQVPLGNAGETLAETFLK